MTMAPEKALTTSAVDPAVGVAIETLHRLQAVRNALAPDLNDQELQLFALVAQRSGLDPFAKQIHAVKRQGRVTFQTGIDGYRATAARTGEYDGSDEPEYGPIVDKPFPHPEWARVTVYRLRADGTRRAQAATAFWDEFYPGESQGHMWKKMPRNQLAKCAEALAFRKAFPHVLADVYVSEELDQAGPLQNAAAAVAAAAPTVGERLKARRAALAEPAPAQDAPGGVDDPAQLPESTVEPGTAGDASPEVVEGVARPMSLSRDELLEGIDALGISRDYAAQFAKRMFPRGELTNAQRAEVLEALRAEEAVL